jgi:hypothetical protein
VVVTPEVIMLFGGALAAGAVPGAHPALAGIVLAGGQATVTWTVCHPVAPLGSGSWNVEVCV